MIGHLTTGDGIAVFAAVFLVLGIIGGMMERPK
jgi:hypothetical protein